MAEMKGSFGDILRRLRKEHGLSQAQLADKLAEYDYSISQNQISTWEQRVYPPSGRAVGALTALFGVDEGVFWGLRQEIEERALILDVEHSLTDAQILQL